MPEKVLNPKSLEKNTDGPWIDLLAVGFFIIGIINLITPSIIEFVLGILFVIASFGLLKRKYYERIMAIVLSVIYLLFLIYVFLASKKIAIGITGIIGVLAIYILTRPKNIKEFKEQKTSFWETITNLGLAAALVMAIVKIIELIRSNFGISIYWFGNGFGIFTTLIVPVIFTLIFALAICHLGKKHNSKPIKIMTPILITTIIVQAVLLGLIGYSSGFRLYSSKQVIILAETIIRTIKLLLFGIMLITLTKKTKIALYSGIAFIASSIITIPLIVYSGFLQTPAQIIYLIAYLLIAILFYKETKSA